jgi:hypothetical protein
LVLEYDALNLVKSATHRSPELPQKEEKSGEVKRKGKGKGKRKRVREEERVK